MGFREKLYSGGVSERGVVAMGVRSEEIVRSHLSVKIHWRLGFRLNGLLSSPKFSAGFRPARPITSCFETPVTQVLMKGTRSVSTKRPRDHEAAGSEGSAEAWQNFVTSFPESFRSLATTDLKVRDVVFAVHQDLLSLHSLVFSDLFASCTSTQASKTQRQCLPLQDDSPADVLAFLTVLYRQARGESRATELLTTSSDAVRVAKISHKYGAELQLKSCDDYLHTQVQDQIMSNNESTSGSKAGDSWGALQWIDFAEQHGLCKTLASWEHWAIEHFDMVQQDILSRSNDINVRSLIRICRGMHEATTFASQLLAPCTTGCTPDGDPSYCRECYKCKVCSGECVWRNNKSVCPQHAVPNGNVSTIFSTISVDTLMSWQQ